jgi:D-glucosaminate-6-phosphate ammonia-lyase
VRSVYERLGVQRFINASGHNTAQGGSLMPPEVLQAMNDAARSFVSLRALQEAAGRQIAGQIGAPAAVVSSGAAGAILLGAAAALAGSDPAAIQALPETAPDGRSQIVVWAAPRPNYMYQACQAAGGKLVEVGQAGAAPAPEPFRDALSDHTAAILLVLAPLDQALGRGAGDTLRWPDLIGAICAHAGARGVPVLVDAASELPPRDLIRRLLDLGVAGVIVSGGKAIRGPQSTGILAGTPDLVAAAHLNNNPLSAIGRPMKVGKEELCGVVAAVERFFALDEREQLAGWEAAATRIARAVPAGAGVQATVIADDPDVGRPPLAPKAVLSFDAGASGASALALALQGGEPAVQPLLQGERLIFNPMTLEPGEDETVASLLRAALRR